MAAQNLVREGVRWRVGNGSNIHIWGDKWLPTSSTYKIASPRQFLHQDTRVSELIDQDSARWKVNVLDALFFPYEADVIKGIPISSSLPPDKMIWAATPNGKFSVKSAYSIAMRQANRVDQGPQMYQAAPVCEGCGLEAETTGHLFWTCPRAREVWTCLKLVVPVDNDRIFSLLDLLWSMLVEESQNVEIVAKVVCIAWAMWRNQNEVQHGGQRRNGKDKVRWASQYMEEYKAATERLSCNEEADEAGGTWSPPPACSFKINGDSAIFANQKAVGVGVIVRDDIGRIEAAMSKKIPILLGAVEVEVMAYEIGLLFVKDIGIHDLIMEGDSLIIHRAMCDMSTPPSSVAVVIQGMQDMCKEFRRVMFSHV
ncbi:uncharacterized protein LOC126689786 [Quercus robur]|uniref:uncharacterized protein LOC126689786 n=1 Tax=Quercus robur TaxID=38942 RepID=UPI002163841A|nr:uncharacterized protein LOC126689786 [Quercus robur]